MKLSILLLTCSSLLSSVAFAEDTLEPTPFEPTIEAALETAVTKLEVVTDEQFEESIDAELERLIGRY